MKFSLVVVVVFSTFLYIQADEIESSCQTGDDACQPAHDEVSLLQTQLHPHPKTKAANLVQGHQRHGAIAETLTHAQKVYWADTKGNTFHGHEKFACKLMLLMICSICCCGGALRHIAGDQKAATINLVCSLGVFTYMLWTGIFSAWWNDEVGLGFACRIMCWWVLVQIIILTIMLSCGCCMVGIFVGAAIILKNEVVKHMKEEYEKKEKNLSGPRKEYYNSALFKTKCDTLFDKADKNKTGSLSAQELEATVKKQLGDVNESSLLGYFMTELFTKNKSSQIERDEFSEMMKFLSVMQLEDGRFNLEQAWEVLMLPDTSTMAEVNRAYKKMALRYHPDKRPGEEKAVVDKDMAEINDAKSLLEKHFQEKKAKEDSK